MWSVSKIISETNNSWFWTRNGAQLAGKFEWCAKFQFRDVTCGGIPFCDVIKHIMVLNWRSRERNRQQPIVWNNFHLLEMINLQNVTLKKFHSSKRRWFQMDYLHYKTKVILGNWFSDYEISSPTILIRTNVTYIRPPHHKTHSNLHN